MDRFFTADEWRQYNEQQKAAELVAQKVAEALKPAPNYRPHGDKAHFEMCRRNRERAWAEQQEMGRLALEQKLEKE